MADEPRTYTQEEVDALVAEQTEGLKRSRDELLGEVKKTKAALKAWDGKDPAKYDELVHAAEEAERKKAAAEGDWKSIEKQLIDRHQQELTKERTRTEKALAALEKRKVAKLTEALAAAGAEPENMDLLILKGSGAIRMRETEEDWEEFVADERGNPLVADGKGTPMDIPTYVEQNLKAKYPALFRGTGSSGGGAAKSNAGGGGRNVITASDLGKGDNLDAFLAGKVQIAE